MEYEISVCREDEVSDLQTFIGTKWAKNHILSRNRDLLDWQHLNREAGLYNFVIARNSETKSIDAILGFVPTCQFDPSLKSTFDLWLTTWKTDETVAKKGLGLELFFFLQKEFKPRSIGSIGLSDFSFNLLKGLRFKVGSMNHHYIPNPSKEYKLLKNASPTSPGKISRKSPLREIEILKGDELPLFENVPQKSVLYLINRYQNHPVYKYKFWGCFDKDELICIFVMRKAYAMGSSCLRLVEVYGPLEKASCVENDFVEILRVENAEYLDIYSFGTSNENIEKMGFKARRGDVIVPNYYEPFEQTNREIRYSYRTKADAYRFFKGDADQDRPSL